MKKSVLPIDPCPVIAFAAVLLLALQALWQVSSVIRLS